MLLIFNFIRQNYISYFHRYTNYAIFYSYFITYKKKTYIQNILKINGFPFRVSELSNDKIIATYNIPINMILF